MSMYTHQEIYAAEQQIHDRVHQAACRETYDGEEQLAQAEKRSGWFDRLVRRMDGNSGFGLGSLCSLLEAWKTPAFCCFRTICNPADWATSTIWSDAALWITLRSRWERSPPSPARFLDKLGFTISTTWEGRR